MKTLIVLIILTVVSGCASNSSTERFEEMAVNMSRLDVTYCDGSGFKSFQDLGSYWSFICNDNRKFIVKYR